ncbi:MAG: site-2 protease family protein [Acholeplasmatales bacterium]|nr:site-2 protease family protein [Acholeplasmatales bacterium]
MFLALSGAPLVLVSIIAFILIIGIIITVHEFGHFICARRAGILCHEFSIGMGPVIYKHQFGETTFCIRAIPIGGFVQMAGEEPMDDLIKKESSIGLNLDSDGNVYEIILDPNRDAHIRGKVIDIDLNGVNGENLFITLDEDGKETYYVVNRNAIYVFEKDQKMQIAPYDRTFDSKGALPRFVTLVAGATMNFILAVIIYIIVAFATGVPDYSSNEIGSLSGDNYPSAGILETGDIITGINGNTISTWEDFQKESKVIYEGYHTTILMTIERNGATITKEIEATTIINSIGLSNLTVKQNDMKLVSVPNSTKKGVMLGALALRYKTRSDKDYEYAPKSGDILTAILVDTKKYNIEDLGDNAWGEISKIFSNSSITTGAHDVYLEYYHKINDNEYKFISTDESKVIEPYTLEVLENQRIDLIEHYVGISPVMHFHFGKCLGDAFVRFGYDFTLIFRTLKLLIAPSDVRQVGVSNLSSFVGIFGVIEKYINRGFIPLLAFVAMLSVNIGIVNLLPIPALDGGRILFLLIEKITRKKISKKAELIINGIFFVLIMVLFVYVTINDIIRLF